MSGQKYVIRERGTNNFVDDSGKLHGDVAHAHVFPSVEEAQFFCDQAGGSSGDFEICELTGDGGAGQSKGKRGK